MVAFHAKAAGKRMLESFRPQIGHRTAQAEGSEEDCKNKPLGCQDMIYTCVLDSYLGCWVAGEEHGNGFTFDGVDEGALNHAIHRALAIYRCSTFVAWV